MNHLQNFLQSLTCEPEDRIQLRERFLAVRQQTVSLCESLEVEDFVVQPNEEVSPIKWHLAHTTWFFEELVLRSFAPDYARYDQGFRVLFNSYYKSAGQHWLQSERGHLSRPTVAQVREYRRVVDLQLAAFLEHAPANPEIDFLMEVGLHHEQQHQELMCMDIKAILATQPQGPILHTQAHGPATAEAPSWVDIQEGVYEVGHQGAGFAYDNEGPAHKTYLYPCAVRSSFISNHEYMEFMNAGAYDEAKWWLSEGWDWVQQQAISHPLYWRRCDDRWQEFTLGGWQDLDPHAPVTHVSYFEADAFANWTGYRLPTEQELEVALKTEQRSDSTAPGPVWAWTRSHYSPYPGYRTFDGMIGEYNGKFMCNQFVLKGGCAASPVGHYRHSYRNFYQPHQRWMFSGIRLAKDLGA